VWLDFIDVLFHSRNLTRILKEIPDTAFLLVTDRYLIRVDKIAYAIQSLGENSIVLITRTRKFRFSNIYRAQFSVRSYYKTAWIIKKLKPKIIHVFSSWSFDLAYYLIRHKQHIPAKIVFDDYDVFAGMLDKKSVSFYYPGQFKKEKYCLENADGLCCRSLETQYCKQSLHYTILGRRIFFAEYMWNKALPPSTVFTKTLVYIGNFNNEVLLLAQKLKTINWSLEIYAAHYAREKVSEACDNLIIHSPVNSNELIKTLQRYPISIQLPRCILDSSDFIYRPEKYLYSASGKIFDYLEAGLKVMIADEVFQRWLLMRYGSAIEIDSNDPLEDIVRKLSNFELPISKKGFSPNHLTLKEQAPRLERFYNSLIAES